jgi:hypothetical protein
MPWLREVTLVRWTGRDLAVLGDKPELTYLRLDCRGQAIDPAGWGRPTGLPQLAVSTLTCPSRTVCYPS